VVKSDDLKPLTIPSKKPASTLKPRKEDMMAVGERRHGRIIMMMNDGYIKYLNTSRRASTHRSAPMAMRIPSKGFT
jgi:hypothetical protein